MARTSRKNRRRHRILGLVAAAAVAVVVALVVVIVVVIVRRPDSPPSAVPPTAVPPPTTRTGADQAAPRVPGRQLPGRDGDRDPRHLGVVAHRRPAEPDAVPAVAAAATSPGRLPQQFGRDRVEVYTVPYTAQFHNPFSADKQMSYNDSRAEGTRAAVKAMTDMNNEVPADQLRAGGLLAGRGDRR